MSPTDTTSDEVNFSTSNVAKAKSIETLLIGSGAEMFRELEQKNNRFCPFEAIGMVRQEIRHAHFLSFILDPNRPHPFGDHLLKTFLQEVIAQAQEDQTTVQPLTIHCADYSNALVHRERHNIDFMIEIPPGSHGTNGKGLVVTVELKVDANESKHQLKKYYDHIVREYPDIDWDRVFVFLTLNATAASGANSEDWIPVDLVDVVERFNQEIAARGFTGEAVELYENYASMIRRHLVKDEELAQLAKNIWAKHKEALDALYDYRPDLQAEVIGWLASNHDELTKTIKKATGFTIVPDTSSGRLLRYSVQDWYDLQGFCQSDNKWVASKSVLVLELTDWQNGRLRFSFVLGPADDADMRTELYEAVLRSVDAGKIKIGRRTAKIGQWKHFSATDVQTEKDYAKAEVNEVTAEELGRKVFKKISTFLETHLPVYDDVIRQVLKD
ncbi:PD-(D/E)XK nuclease family protein [Tateyamaria sp.]|uniref:PD-(D/E)XK nuclease family protein n=1 Tax=Tateyamaria sp. TaxID=1929288 RepID=UPI00329CEBA2